MDGSRKWRERKRGLAPLGQESNPLFLRFRRLRMRISHLKDGNVSPESAALEDCSEGSDIACVGFIFGIITLLKKF